MERHCKPIVTPAAVFNSAALGFVEPKWYAVYTCANHERCVAEHLAARSVENFLPQYESVHRWKDRRVRLRRPLFPGYVFVHIALCNRVEVLQVPGVARFVGFAGDAASVPEEDLTRIREFLSKGYLAEPHRLVKVGRRVRIVRGPLEGMEGVMIKRKNRRRVIISFEFICRAMAVEVDDSTLALVDARIP